MKAQADDLADFPVTGTSKKKTKGKKAAVPLPSAKAASWQLKIERHMALKEDDRTLAAASDDDEDGNEEAEEEG